MAAHQVSMVAGTVWLTGAPGLLNRLADVSRGLADKTTAPAARLQERLVSLMARDGQPRPVLDAAASVYELAVQHDAVYGQWLAAKKASDAARWAGDRSVSARWARRALSAMVRFGPTGNSTLLEHRGNLAVVLGDPAAAVHLFGASAAQSVRESSGWPGQSETAPHLELVRSSLGAHTVDELWATGQRLGMDDLHEKAEAVVR
jgi:ABC-type transporter Mla subunit MlaD